MAESDLRDRIREGDLAAMADPALPLHVLAEPGAEWLAEGAQHICRQLGCGAFADYELGCLQSERRFRSYVHTARLLLNLVPAPSTDFLAALAALEALCPSSR